MWKKYVSSLIAVTMLAACGSSAKTKEVTADDASSEASKLVEDLGLKDKTDLIEDKIVQGLFFFEDGVVTADSVYIANDKTPDMVGVFATTDVDSCKQSITDYLKNLKQTVQSYSPDEVFKIDNAIIEDNGKEVIVVVCNDIETAKKEVDSLLGK